MNYLENYIANSPVKQVNPATPAVENKTDKVNKVSFKGNKKKIALALAGMAAVGIAGVLIYKKISLPKKILSESIPLQDLSESIPLKDLSESLPLKDLSESLPLKDLSESLPLQDEAMNILKESNAVSEEASKILADAQKLVKETTLKIKEALKSSPEKIKEEDGQKVFEELQEGILKRKSFFSLKNDEVIVNRIETYKENGLKDIIGLQNNSIKSVLLGVKELADGTRRVIAKMFFFEDGKLFEFHQNYKDFADETRKILEKFFFKDGKFTVFSQNYIDIASGDLETAKSFCFKDGKLTEARQHGKLLADLTWEDDKRFFF